MEKSTSNTTKLFWTEQEVVALLLADAEAKGSTYERRDVRMHGLDTLHDLPATKRDMGLTIVIEE